MVNITFWRIGGINGENIVKKPSTPPSFDNMIQ
jgi:hypothetical protein